MKPQKTKLLKLQPVTVRHQVAVGGRVVDDTPKRPRPVPGAGVRITGGGLKVAQQVTTSAAGLYYFLDLPDGTYDLEAWNAADGTRRGKVRQRAKVSRDSEGNIANLFLNLTLKTTTVRGVVTAAAGKAPIAMALVRIKGTPEQTFTDSEGQYWLRGVEKGDRRVQVFAQGFKQAEEPVKVTEPGGEYSLDFRLTRSKE